MKLVLIGGRPERAAERPENCLFFTGEFLLAVGRTYTLDAYRDGKVTGLLMVI